MPNHFMQFTNTFFIGGKLGPKIGDILICISSRILCRVKNCTHLFLAIHSRIDKLEIVDQNALFFNML